MTRTDDAMLAAPAAAGVLSIRRRGRAQVVILSGDLDAHAVRAVRTALGQLVTPGVQAIVVDAEAVTSADPILLSLVAELSAHAVLYLAAPSPSVKRLVDSAGGKTTVRLVLSLGEALDAVGI